ncbi:unnamed protein product [Enterobius vermicularis]|uniref:Endostatin domain-containing protein n=1 Tax=Enterobius vermicularis TaxID=51028 RepID=A0A0N4VAY9_ENTVE|nr:unnamed protein product [Enterobius vermicularis]
MVWHGTDDRGMTTSSVCREWRYGGNRDVGRASPLGPGLNLIRNSVDVDCSRRLAVLCIEVQHELRRLSTTLE